MLVILLRRPAPALHLRIILILAAAGKGLQARPSRPGSLTLEVRSWLACALPGREVRCRHALSASGAGWTCPWLTPRRLRLARACGQRPCEWTRCYRRGRALRRSPPRAAMPRSTRQDQPPVADYWRSKLAFGGEAANAILIRAGKVDAGATKNGQCSARKTTTA
jgi:hypothetical protein